MLAKKAGPGSKPKSAVAEKPSAKGPSPRAFAKKSAVEKSQFPAVFARLKAILKPYAAGMIVVKDDDAWYYLDTKLIGPNKKPVMFAATRLGKAYVSYYLMSVCYPNLLAAISPELRKRMQGKSCFNFTEIDEPLFAELETVTRAGADFFKNGGLEKMLANGRCD